jgi:hypothetical protein
MYLRKVGVDIVGCRLREQFVPRELGSNLVFSDCSLFVRCEKLTDGGDLFVCSDQPPTAIRSRVVASTVTDRRVKRLAIARCDEETV